MVKILQDNSATKGPSKKETQSNKILSAFRKKEEEEITSAYAAELGLPYIDTNLIPISTDDIRLLAEADSRRLEIAIIHFKGKMATVVAPL